MKLREYDAEGYRQNLEVAPEHPGVQLRQRLSSVPAPEANAALDELLYTAGETYLLGDTALDTEQALTVWRLVELSRNMSAADLVKVRM